MYRVVCTYKELHAGASMARHPLRKPEIKDTNLMIQQQHPARGKRLFAMRRFIYKRISPVFFPIVVFCSLVFYTFTRDLRCNVEKRVRWFFIFFFCCESFWSMIPEKPQISGHNLQNQCTWLKKKFSFIFFK